MPNTVVYFEATSGECEVQNFLDDLRRVSRKAAAKCHQYIGLLEQLGRGLRYPYARHVDGPIWELRPEYGGVEYRFLYAQIGPDRFILLTAFMKDYQELRDQDIERAHRRLAEYKERHLR